MSNNFSTNQVWSCAFGFWTLMSLGPGTQSLGLGLETQKYLDLGLEHLRLDISGHIVLYCITIV